MQNWVHAGGQGYVHARVSGGLMLRALCGGGSLGSAARPGSSVALCSMEVGPPGSSLPLWGDPSQGSHNVRVHRPGLGTLPPSA